MYSESGKFIANRDGKKSLKSIRETDEVGIPQKIFQVLNIQETACSGSFRRR